MDHDPFLVSVELRMPPPDEEELFTFSNEAVIGPLTITILAIRQEGESWTFQPRVNSYPLTTCPLCSFKLCVTCANEISCYRKTFSFEWYEVTDSAYESGCESGYECRDVKGWEISGYGFFDDRSSRLDGHLRFQIDLTLDEGDYASDCLCQMWIDMLFPDMHLISEYGDEIRCHRAVLCGASSVFKTMFTGEFKEASHGEVVIHDASGADIRSFLEFVYTANLPYGRDHGALRRLLRMADMYDIPDLADLCALRLLLLVDASNVAETVTALSPYHQSARVFLSQCSDALVQLLQYNEKLLVSVLSKVRVDSSPDQSFPPEFEDATPKYVLAETSDSMAHIALGLPAIDEEAKAESVDPDTCSLPLLKPECQQHVEVKVLRFSLTPPGLDLQSFAHEASSTEPFQSLAISVLYFNRCTKDFSTALRESGSAQKLLARGVDLEPSWANGAKVFVENLRPETLEPVLNLDSLRPWHVLVLSENETDVVEALGAAWQAGRFQPRCPRARKACTQRLTLQSVGDTVQVCKVDSPHPRETVVAQDDAVASGDLWATSQIDKQAISLDAAGTLHYHVPPSLSPRSMCTAPP